MPVKLKKPTILLAPINPNNPNDRIFAKSLRKCKIPYRYTAYSPRTKALVVEEKDLRKAKKCLNETLGLDIL